MHFAWSVYKFWKGCKILTSTVSDYEHTPHPPVSNIVCQVEHCSGELPSVNSDQPHMAVRKRSITALGHLVPSCSPALFTQLTEHLMGKLSRGPPTANVRTYIQCLATVSRRGGHRIGESWFNISARILSVLRECSGIVWPAERAEETS